MIRIVLDTNILVSALLNSKGPPAEVFLLTVLEPDMQLCVSGDIYAEYEEVIRRLSSTAVTAKSRERFAPFASGDSGSGQPRKCVPVPTPTMTFSWNAHRLPMPITWSRAI